MRGFVAYLRGKDRTTALVCLLFLLYLFLYIALPVMLGPGLTVNNSWMFYFLGFILATVFGGCVLTRNMDDWLIPDLIFLVLPRLYDAGDIYHTGSKSLLMLAALFFIHILLQAVVLLITKWLLFGVRVLNDCGLVNPDEE